MAMNPPLPYTLGLDIGMASVGAALLTDQRILGLHVRTFDKAETAKEGDPLNKTRRESRLTRRRIRRRAHRLLRLVRLFKRTGMIAEAHPEAFALPGVSPWDLRADGLDRLLAPAEWAAVLYHMVKHRGFQSTRKSEAKDDEKTGQMLSGVSDNQRRMKEKGWRTVGEMAARDEAFSEAKRNKGGAYTHTFARADLVAELKLLFKQQAGFGNPHVSADFENSSEQLLLARRPALAGDALLKLIGKCPFEPADYRAPKASYSAERFVWLTKLNNLRISEVGEQRALTAGERQILLDQPYLLAKFTYKQARQRLGLADTAKFTVLTYRGDKDPESAAFFEAKAYHELRKAYEKADLEKFWQRDALDPVRLDRLAWALTCYKTDDDIRTHLAEHSVEPDIIEAVLGESFDKFVGLSPKALGKILPFMEQGQRYDEAVQSAGYAHHSHLNRDATKAQYLPPPDKDQIRNPVVYRALNQARKLVNAIVREYGPPAAIHIELARDLSKPMDERRKIEREQKEFQERKAKDREAFVDQFGFDPKGLDLQKYRLYREQLSQCAYSQKEIVVTRLFESGYAEIDHALPYSRSFDDGQNNKVLVLTAENRNKGNRTPYEYLDGASDSPQWQQFEAWVLQNKAYRRAKRDRLLRKHFGEDEAQSFRERNLNDTRYICRAFKQMVETHLQWHADSDAKNRCVVVAGQLTSLLRARWGLIKMRENGDLHHALDAAVIAAASRSLVKRMADYSKRNELAQVRDRYLDPATGEILDIAAMRQVEEHFPAPWPHFRSELLAWLSPDPAHGLDGLSHYPSDELECLHPVRVSRAPTRRGLGAAHQETIRSVGREGRLLADGQSTIKTPLTSLKLKDLDSIVGAEDPRNVAWISLLRERLEQFKGDGAKAFAANQPPLIKPSAPDKQAPAIRSVKLLATQKSGIPVRKGIANNGSMLRVDVFSKGGKFYAVPVYVADAARAELPNRAVVQSKPEGEWPEMDATYAFLFSLHPNDWVCLRYKNAPSREGYFSGLNRATGAIDIWVHDRNPATVKNGLFEGNGMKTALAVEKYHVDLLGNLHRVHVEKRLPIHYGKASKG
ncbi:MAG: type II CRISPR RNA-guided endonuclease Cas9 [Thiobacillus sp.]